MGVLLFGGAVFVAAKVAKRLKKNRANRRLANEVAVSVASAVRTGKSPYEDELRNASQQEVLAMLVDGVYYRDRDSSDLKLLVKPFIEGEYEVDKRMVHFTSTLYWTRLESITEEEERNTGIKHYIRHPHNPNKSAPSLVIAIRGTKLSKCRDLVDNIKLSASTLHFSDRFKKSRDLVKKIIEEYAKWQRSDHEESSESSHRGYASRSSGPPPVHQRVRCDVCNMDPIIGPRYKSNKEYNYDLCQECFQKYGDSKDYTKFDKPLERPASESPHRESASGSSGPPPVHQRVHCDVCNMDPIIGPRYKSNKEYNYDLCQECFQKYGDSKDYAKFVKPLERPASESPHRESASGSSGPPPVHQRVHCDVCNMDPIIGPRYKSNKEYNYDLCQECFQKYGASKDYTKFDKPLGRQTRAVLQSHQFGYDDDDEDDSEVDDDDSELDDVDSELVGDDSEVDDDDSELDDDDYSESVNDIMLEVSRLALKPVQHAGIECDICRSNPIVGIRYKSIKKHGYYLCQQCFQKHGALTDYTKFEKPLASTSSPSSSSMATGNDIYITGHSLGAALALQIGKWLATKEKQRYNVHCFNPPFMTIVQLIQQGIFIPKAKELLRKTPLEPVINLASHVKNFAKFSMAITMNNGDQLMEEVTHYLSLHDWVPVLYVNKHDGICNKFKKYYKQKQKLSTDFEVCSQALISKVLGRRALFSSLVPSVDMRVSKRLDKSHALKNWYRDPAIDKRRQYRLIPEHMIPNHTFMLGPDDSFAGSLIHALAEAILYDTDSDEEDSDLD